MGYPPPSEPARQCPDISGTVTKPTYPDSFGEFEDGELIMVTNVHRSGFRSVHQENQTIDKVMNILEGPGLAAVTVYSHILALESLNNEVGNDSTIVRVHSRTEGVEDTGNPHIHTVLPLVTVGEGLGNSLALVVAGPNADAVDVSPVLLALRVLLRVTVNLGSGGDEEPRLGSLGETQHVECSHERGLDRLDSVVLVMRGRRGASEMVDFCISVC